MSFKDKNAFIVLCFLPKLDIKMNTKNTLLIAEDEPELAAFLMEELVDLGFSVIIARDGQEMLDHALNNPDIAAILSDINMPIMSGLEVLKEIRQQGLETPVVFLTGDADKEKVIEALRFGALEFLEKPITISKLAKILTEAMELGIELKRVDDELSILAKQYAEKFGMDESEMNQFKALQKPILLMKLKCSLANRGRKP